MNNTTDQPNTPSLPTIDRIVDTLVYPNSDLTNGDSLLYNHPITLSGSGAPNSWFYLYDNGNVIALVNVDAHGHWERNLNPPSLGEHAYTTSPDGAAFALAIQPLPPATIDHVNDTLTYPYPDLTSGDSLLYNHPITLSGSGAPNSSFYLYDNGNVVALVNVDANGHWERNLNPPSLGDHVYSTQPDGASFVLTVESTLVNPMDPVDPAHPADPSQPTDPILPGDPSQPASDVPVDITKPVTNPVIEHVYDTTGHELNNGATTEDPRLTVTGSGGQPGATVYIINGDYADRTLGDYRELGQAIVQADGTWTVTFSSDLLQGDHSTFFAMLSNGPQDFVSEQFTLNELGSTQPPAALEISSINNADGEHHNGDTISGDPAILHGVAIPASDGGTCYIQLYIDGIGHGSVEVDASGHWQIDTRSYFLAKDLTAGTHTVIVVQDGHASQPFTYTVSGNQADLADAEHPADPPTPVDPVDPGHPSHASTSADLIESTHPAGNPHPGDQDAPAHPAELAPITVTFDGLINDNYGHPPYDVPRDGTTNIAFPTVYGTGPAGLGVTIIDQATGRTLGGAYIDQDGHWQAKIQVSLSDGHHELYATVFGHNSDTFPVNIEFGSSTASADTASTLSVNDLLAHGDATLFGHDAPQAETHATSAAKLDVQDLSHVQTGGVSADVSAATQHALAPQEQHQHH
jgi:hypothetical protein